MNKYIDFPPARKNRSEALQWWATLAPEDRIIYCETHHGEERHPATLTGKEIQKIFEIAKE